MAKWHPLIADFVTCPLCVGFWLALGITALVWTNVRTLVIHGFAVAFIGFLAYQFIEKYAPCKNCTSQEEFNDWKEMV